MRAFEGEIHHSISNEYIDSILRQNFHYELARNLGQLDQPQIRQANNGWNAYKKLVMFDGIIEGNIKPEPLKKSPWIVWNNYERDEAI